MRRSPPIVVALVAVAVRLPAVWARPFWEDEVASARALAEPTVGALLRHVARTESTPPLWYLLTWAVRQAGVPMQDLRLISVLAGGLLAAVVVVIARRFVTQPLAVAAGLFVAVGAEFVDHGHELRAYELAALLSALLGLLLVRELERPSRRNELLLTATVAAGGLTHYFFAFSVLAAIAWAILDPGARAIRRRTLSALACGGVVAATGAPMLLQQMHQNRYSWIGTFRLRFVTAVPLRLFTYAFNQTTPGLILSLATVAVVGGGAVRLARRSPAGRLVALLALAPVVEAAVVWETGMRVFDLRNLIGVGAFVAVAAVAALDSLPARVAPVLALGSACVIAASLLIGNVDPIQPFGTIAQTLVRDGWHASTPIAVFGDPLRSSGPLGWYLPRHPRLAIGRESICSSVLVVQRSGRVVDLRPRTSIARDPALRGATLLVDASHRVRCTRRDMS